MNKNNEQPYFSVVLCTYNGVRKIRSCLEALKKQTYKNYELIVVDDGSSDGTSDVAKQFACTLIEHQKNLGLAAARNTGIKVSKGTFIAFTDDDCVPDKNWLKSLEDAYRKFPAAGIGGKIIVGNKPKTLLAKYLIHQNPLSPLSSDLLVSSNILYRFTLYIKNMFIRNEIKNIDKVYSLIGANMSFKKEVLLKVGLFDTNFKFGADEEDVSRRIHSMKLGDLYYAPNSIVYHIFDTHLKSILKRSLSYGIGSARLFCKHKEMNPTFYPFPFLILTSLLLIYLSKSLILLPFIFPIIMYPNWVYKCILTRNLQFLAFPYLQMLNEFSTDIGFIKGYLKYRKYW